MTVLAVDGDRTEQTSASRDTIAIAPAPRAFRPTADGIAVLGEDDTWREFDVLYAALGCRIHSDLAKALGARCNSAGAIEVDAHQRTSIAGLYAAGDVVSDLRQLSVAEGHAAIAATAIHNSLPRNWR